MTEATAGPAKWLKSKACGTNACVEVAKVDGAYLVRDSKNPEGTVLSFTEAEWVAFTKGVMAGEFHF
jgi:uncharacterized protein DUF397